MVAGLAPVIAPQRGIVVFGPGFAPVDDSIVLKLMRKYNLHPG
jgi:hypothetical protein